MSDLSNLSTAELCDRLANVWVHDLPTTDDIAVIDEAARRLRALAYHDEDLRTLHSDIVYRVKNAAVLLSETSARNDRVDLAESIAGGVDQIRDNAEAVTRNAEHQIALKHSALDRLEKAEAKIRALTELTSSTLKGRPNLGDLRSLAEGETITVAWLQYVEALEKQVRALTEWRPGREKPTDDRAYLILDITGSIWKAKWDSHQRAWCSIPDVDNQWRWESYEVRAWIHESALVGALPEYTEGE